jgi:hypothetical protein
VPGRDLAQRQDATAIHHDQSLVAPGVEVRYLKRAPGTHDAINGVGSGDGGLADAHADKDNVH